MLNQQKAIKNRVFYYPDPGIVDLKFNTKQQILNILNRNQQISLQSFDIIKKQYSDQNQNNSIRQFQKSLQQSTQTGNHLNLGTENKNQKCELNCLDQISEQNQQSVIVQNKKINVRKQNTIHKRQSKSKKYKKHNEIEQHDLENSIQYYSKCQSQIQHLPYARYVYSGNIRPQQKFFLQKCKKIKKCSTTGRQIAFLHCSNVLCKSFITIFRGRYDQKFRITNFQNVHEHQIWQNYQARKQKAKQYLSILIEKYRKQNKYKSVQKAVTDFYDQYWHNTLMRGHRFDVYITDYYKILNDLVCSSNIKQIARIMAIRGCKYYSKTHNSLKMSQIPQAILYWDSTMMQYHRKFADAIHIERVIFKKQCGIFAMGGQFMNKNLMEQKLKRYRTEMIFVKGLNQKNKEVILAIAIYNVNLYNKQELSIKTADIYSWIFKKLFGYRSSQQSYEQSLHLPTETVAIITKMSERNTSLKTNMQAINRIWYAAINNYERNYQSKQAEVQHFAQQIQLQKPKNKIKQKLKNPKFMVFDYDYKSNFITELSQKVNLNIRNSQILPILKNLFEERNKKYANKKLVKIEQIFPYDYKFIRDRFNDKYDEKGQLQRSGMGYYNVGPRFFGFNLSGSVLFLNKQMVDFKKLVSLESVMNYIQKLNFERQSKLDEQIGSLLSWDSKDQKSMFGFSSLALNSFTKYKDPRLQRTIRILNNQQLRCLFLKEYKIAHDSNVQLGTIRQLDEDWRQQNKSINIECECLYRQQTGFPCSHQIQYCLINKIDYDLLIKPRWKNQARLATILHRQMSIQRNQTIQIIQDEPYKPLLSDLSNMDQQIQIIGPQQQPFCSLNQTGHINSQLDIEYEKIHIKRGANQDNLIRLADNFAREMKKEKKNKEITQLQQQNYNKKDIKQVNQKIIAQIFQQSDDSSNQLFEFVQKMQNEKTLYDSNKNIQIIIDQQFNLSESQIDLDQKIDTIQIIQSKKQERPRLLLQKGKKQQQERQIIFIQDQKPGESAYVQRKQTNTNKNNKKFELTKNKQKEDIYF